MMKTIKISFSVIFFLLYIIGCKQSTNKLGETSQTSTQMNESVPKRVGMVIKIKEDQIEEYKRIHGNDYQGVRDLLIKYNMRNFSILLQKLEDWNFY